MKVLLTGGAGYIGSHTLLELIKKSFDVTVVDNLVNSSFEAVKRVQLISGKHINFLPMDLLDKKEINKLFDKHDFDTVIHLAGLKAVSESIENPLTYYENNISGTINLCNAMMNHGVNNLIFSSSATVYGNPSELPLKEESSITCATHPYGQTKLTIEKILMDLSESNPHWNSVILRYFNPGGAHHSGHIGEDPNGIPNNLIPFISQCAAGRRKELTIFGNDYFTHDGTCIRDYVHVVDLAIGHVAALNKIKERPGGVIYNLGTGKGSSVLEVIHTFERVNEVKIPYVFGPRRAGDIAESYTDPTKANRELKWRAVATLENICQDAWNWQRHNPLGYDA